MATTEKILVPLQHWIEDYLPNAVGRKHNTIQSYKDSWRLVIMYFNTLGIKAEDITYDMLTYQRLMKFLDWVEKDRKCKVSTRNNRLSAISKFSQYSVNMDFESASVLSRAVSKIPYKDISDGTERAYFTKEELKVFLALPTPKSNMGIRDHALLEYMYATGERADEVCKTVVNDIRMLDDGKASVLVHGKGGKDRRIKIFEKPASVISKYIRYRRIGNQPNAFVFPSQRNAQMSLKCIEEIYSKYIKLARNERPDLFKATSYPPHSMRHTTATHMVDAGVPMIVIKQFLGHEHLATTEIYAKISPETANRSLVDWSKDFWNIYMDEPMDIDDILKSSDPVPNFLK